MQPYIFALRLLLTPLFYTLILKSLALLYDQQLGFYVVSEFGHVAHSLNSPFWCWNLALLSPIVCIFR